jgi:uncharacterized protein (DUF433 family)
VETILELLSSGMTTEDILADYADHINQCSESDALNLLKRERVVSGCRSGV